MPHPPSPPEERMQCQNSPHHSGRPGGAIQIEPEEPHAYRGAVNNEILMVYFLFMFLEFNSL